MMNTGFMRFSVLLVAIGSALAAGGCASGNAIEEAVPAGANQPMPAPSSPTGIPAEIAPAQGVAGESGSAGAASPGVQTLPPAASPAARNTGAYPNINVMPQGETAQLSDSEVSAKKAELLAQAEAQRQNGESAAAYLARLRRLQKLGSTHAAAALSAIEASQ